jgi:hypothetical protein
MSARPKLQPVDDVELPEGPFDVPINGKGLSIPLIRVTPADGASYVVQAYNPDLLLFEDTAAKHRWKGPGEAPFRWLTFLAWAASRRTGKIGKDVTWESFSTSTLQIESVDDDAATARPTRPGPEPG